MISYAPLWETMKKKNITTYDLRERLKIGGGTFGRLKNNLSISTHTVDVLCFYLDCEVQDVICHVKTGGEIYPTNPKLR